VVLSNAKAFTNLFTPQGFALRSEPFALIAPVGGLSFALGACRHSPRTLQCDDK
jgi:hypothetical protein